MKRVAAFRWLLAAVLAGTTAASAAAADDSIIWATAEYLLWWTSNGPAPPPLATTAPPNSPATFPGALGNPDTSIALGGEPLSQPARHGGRITLGGWLPTDPSTGLEATYLFLPEHNVSESARGGSTLVLASPFLDASPAQLGQTAVYQAFPHLPIFTPGHSGSARLTLSGEVHGAEINGLLSLLSREMGQLQLLAGYRFFYLDETLRLATTQTDENNVFEGQFLNTLDEFTARNYFHGGQLGLRGSLDNGYWFVESTVKVALGNNHEVVRIRGSTTTNTGPLGTEIPVTTVPGGIYALPSNSGTYARDCFAALPEFSLQTGLYISSNVRVFVGYNFLFLGDVVRPGNQIDTTLNRTQIAANTGVPTTPVGEARPRHTFAGSDYWVQGINFGLTAGW